MVKLLGSACILAGGALAWQIQMAERRRRRDTLSDVLSALRRMAEEIRMVRTPLPVLLEALSADGGPAAASFFHGAAEAARRGEALPKAWGRLAEDLPLPEKDKKALAALGEDLHGDEESVCKAISLVVYELAKSGEDMERNRQAEEKRATALCFSTAALLVILLI